MDIVNNRETTDNISPKKEKVKPEFFLHIIKSATSSDSQPQHQSPLHSSETNEEPQELSDIESARQRFKEISECIDNEEKHLKQLEERRRKLEKDMERLQRDIEMEKEFFRQKLEADLARKAELQDISSGEASPTTHRHKIDPLSINTEEIEDRLREYREAVEDSQLQSILHEDDADIKRLRENLVTYKRALAETRKEKIVKQKRKAAAKIFQRHLDEVEVKCSEQIDKLSIIQKSIGNANSITNDGYLDRINL